jgi:prepilin-type N-terminal cleavage/methylation domain-containing protein
MTLENSEQPRGFSLVELLIVVAIIGLLSSIAVPSLNRSMTLYRLTASASIICEELDAARVLAISRGTTYELRVANGGRAIQIIDRADPSNPPRVAKQLEPGVNITFSPAQPIRFFPRGFAGAGDLLIQGTDGRVMRVSVRTSGKIEVSNVCDGQSSAG